MKFGIENCKEENGDQRTEIKREPRSENRCGVCYRGGRDYRPTLCALILTYLDYTSWIE